MIAKNSFENFIMFSASETGMNKSLTTHDLFSDLLFFSHSFPSSSSSFVRLLFCNEYLSQTDYTTREFITLLTFTPSISIN